MRGRELIMLAAATALLLLSASCRHKCAELKDEPPPEPLELSDLVPPGATKLTGVERVPEGTLEIYRSDQSVRDLASYIDATLSHWRFEVSDWRTNHSTRSRWLQASSGDRQLLIMLRREDPAVVVSVLEHERTTHINEGNPF